VIPLLGETKEKMLEELRRGKRTAKDLSEVLNIQVSAARRHLENLSALNIVQEEFAQEGIGRPKKYYILTEEGRELYPRQYEKFLCSILGKIGNSTGQIGEAVVKQIAQEMATEMKSNGHSSGREELGIKAERLLKALNDFGFDSTLENEGSRVVVTSRNCPFYKAAMRHQKIVCHGLHDEILKVAFDSKDVRLEQSVTRGDSACRHVIEKKGIGASARF
jgi:predicted ArsR family transcriptional regulator